MSGGASESAMRALYNDKLMAFANDIPLQHRLDAPDATIERRSPLCGSRITVDLKLADGKVADYGHIVRACTLGQAASSIMARRVIGEDAETLLAIAEAMRNMMKDGAALPDGLWEELQMLAPAHEYKSRHGSVLLAFEAVEQAIQSIQQTQE
jgi:NifU-like protein involved in Fe-S cluster formation